MTIRKNIKYLTIVLLLLSSFIWLAFQQNPKAIKGHPEKFGFGRTPSEAEIQAIDIDVRPDGKGLPDGEGTVAEGRTIYKMKCAVCHGATGKEGPQDKLVGRTPKEGSLFAESIVIAQQKTIGNYWPYASTIFDYTYRSMPQTSPGSLTPNEVYSLVAFLLFENEIIAEDAILNQETLPKVKMPAEEYFVNPYE